jgi:hypothetical protein
VQKSDEQPNGEFRIPEVGTRIRLVAMPDDPEPVPPGTTGTVTSVYRFADGAQVSVDWDPSAGRSLCLWIPPDTYEEVQP